MTAQSLFPDADDFLVVSLGCGSGPRVTFQRDDLQDYGLLGWGPYIIPMLMEGSVQYTRSLMDVASNNPLITKTLPKIRFIHLSPNDLQENIANNMDLTSDSALRQINGAALAYLNMKSTKDTIRNLVKEFKQQRKYASALGEDTIWGINE